MEEKKLSVDAQRREQAILVQKGEQEENTKILFDKSVTKIMSDGPNENWFELRF